MGGWDGRYYTECPGQCVRCGGRNRRNEWDRCVGGIEQEDAIFGLRAMNLQSYMPHVGCKVALRGWCSMCRAGRCYHRLRSYADSMLKRKMGLLLDDGMDRIDAMEGLMMAML